MRDKDGMYVGMSATKLRVASFNGYLKQIKRG